MKIVFICGSLESGQDGIGDYTRKLAYECDAQGVSCILISVNDKYISELQSGITGNIPFYRIPMQMTWNQKGAELSKILEIISPFDWISFQFVAYGFNKKGILWGLNPLVGCLKPYNLHVMLHELWVAEEKGVSFKMKVLGIVQKWSITSFINKLKPSIVQTSIPLYQKILALNGIKSTLLPLFSNIRFQKFYPAEFKNQVPDELIINRNQLIVGCIFGSVYNESWDLSSLFTILRQESNVTGKRIMIVSIGKIGFGDIFWKSLPLKHPDINFVTLGPKAEEFVSYWLSNFVDFGIVTTPAIIAGKSGSCMAFLEHGIPVFCKKNDLSFSFKTSQNMFDDRVIQVSEVEVFKLPSRNPPIVKLQGTVQQFIKTLNSYQK